MRISFIGIGRLGIATALCFSKAGYEVMGMDINKEYVESINNRTLQSCEPGVVDYLLMDTDLRATSDLREVLEFSDYIFILVPTPDGPDGYDHSILSSLLLQIGDTEIKKKYIIIVSTVMPHYIDTIAKELVKGNKIIYNPEFIRQGSIIQDFMNPDMILIGGDTPDDCEKIKNIYERFMPENTKYNLMSIIEAEVCKISLNGFLTMKIAYANLIGDLVTSLGGDPETVLKAIGSDNRIGNKFLSYGYSFSGPCLPRDVRALSGVISREGFDDSLIKSITKTNDKHVEYLTERLRPNSDDTYVFERVAYKDTKVPIITESCKLRMAEILSSCYNVVIRDTRDIINEVRKVYGNRFKYEIIQN